MNLFGWLNHICYEKGDWSSFNEEDKKSWNTYMILKYLSMSKDYIEFINQLQKYQNLPPQHIYTVLKNIIPTKKQWLKYVKSHVKEPNKELIKLLSTYFETCTEESKINLNLLSKNQISEILIDIGTSDKEIKRIMK